MLSVIIHVHVHVYYPNSVVYSDIVRILIDRADDICKVSVDLFNSEYKYKTGSHTPWKGYVSDKIRGTWTRLRGGKGHKSPVADQGTVHYTTLQHMYCTCNM